MAQLWAMGIFQNSEASQQPKDVLFVCEFCWGNVRFGCYKPMRKFKFLRIHYLSWPNHVPVGANSNRNRLPLGTLLYSYNRQQLTTIMSTRECLQGDHMTPEMNCWDDMRRFNVTRKGQHSLFEPILQCVPRHIATRLINFCHYYFHLTISSNCYCNSKPNFSSKNMH